MLPDPNLRTELLALPRISIHGPWYRAVAYEHLKNPPPGAPPGSPVQPLWPGGPSPLRIRVYYMIREDFSRAWRDLEERRGCLVEEIRRPEDQGTLVNR